MPRTQLGWPPQHHTPRPPRHSHETCTPQHTETVLTGELGHRTGAYWGTGGAGVGRVLLAPRRSHGLHCSGVLVPVARAKRNESLCPGPSAPAPPSPGTLWGALGEPTVAARQGRQDMGRGLLPTLVMLLPAREGILCRARGGCTHQANSPNSPSRGRTQPVQLPCMYRYLHMYTDVLRAGSCPALRTHQHAQGWGQGAITLCQPLTNTHIWHKTHPHPPQPFPCVTR